MRKRIVIGLLAVLVIGMVAFFLSQPKRGTVEWHKREYLRAVQGSWMERVMNVARRFLGKQPFFSYSAEQFAKEEEHRRALIDLGYLEEREFVISNRPIDYVIREANRLILADPRWKHARHDFIHNDPRGSNVMITVTTRDDMPIFVEAVRKADMP